MTTRYPWYWNWRGWRASTWIFLLWTALVWRQVVPLLREDDDDYLFSLRDLATVFILFWLIGVWFIGMARLIAGDRRRPRPPQAERRSAGAVVRAVAPFAAVVLLAFVVLGPTALTVE